MLHLIIEIAAQIHRLSDVILLPFIALILGHWPNSMSVYAVLVPALVVAAALGRITSYLLVHTSRPVYVLVCVCIGAVGMSLWQFLLSLGNDRDVTLYSSSIANKENITLYLTALAAVGFTVSGFVVSRILQAQSIEKHK